MQEVGALKAIFSALYISVLARNFDINCFHKKWAYKQLNSQCYTKHVHHCNKKNHHQLALMPCRVEQETFPPKCELCGSCHADLLGMKLFINRLFVGLLRIFITRGEMNCTDTKLCTHQKQKT